MAKLLYISLEDLEEGRIEMEQLLAEDEIWQEKLIRIKQFEEDEKARRDAEYAEQKMYMQTQKEAPE
jgi:hypothetical protein